MTQNRIGLYIHIPFCRQKCRYCDFVSLGGAFASPENQRIYVRALLQEMVEQSAQIPDGITVDTIYVGGGTPTVLDVRLMNDILEQVFRLFRVAPAGELEMTIEANPESLDPSRCRAIRASGFSRVSLGVQSLHDEELRALGRCHDAATAESAVALVRELVTGNISLDAMFGIPGQTLSTWERTLEGLLAMRPAHLSFYGLQIETGTPFYEDYRRGRLHVPEPDAERAMYEAALGMTAACGYGHYEISNVALPGFQCRHNLKYWSMDEYVGLGLSAHSFTGGIRRENTAEWERYIAGAYVCAQESGDAAERMGDYIFTALRRIEGFERSDFRARFGTEFEAEFGAAAEQLVQRGWLACDAKTVRLTREGMHRTNVVMGWLLNERGA